jgi:hypothetical protein
MKLSQLETIRERAVALRLPVQWHDDGAASGGVWLSVGDHERNPFATLAYWSGDTTNHFAVSVVAVTPAKLVEIVKELVETHARLTDGIEMPAPSWEGA